MVIQRSAPTTAGVNFGDLSMYSGSTFVPDGEYVLFFNVVMHQNKDGQGAAKGPVRLGTMVDFYPMGEPTEDKKLQQFYSMGSKADQSFAPNPETGKGIVTIPGAAGTSLNDKTNWFLLLKSLMDSGLPSGVFSNDLSVIDGVHVHIQNVDEPAERATFASATAEVAQEPRKVNKIAVVTEILEGGKPWEGTGGMPNGTQAKAKAMAPKAAPKPVAVAKPIVKPVVPTAPQGSDDVDVRNAAISGIADVLQKNPNGLFLIKLRNETFKMVKSSHNEETAGAVISNFLDAGHEDNLNGVLGELGYTLQGQQVKALS